MLRPRTTFARCLHYSNLKADTEYSFIPALNTAKFTPIYRNALCCPLGPRYTFQQFSSLTTNCWCC